MTEADWRWRMCELRNLIREGIAEERCCGCGCGGWGIEFLQPDHPRAVLWMAKAEAETWH
jgi:hypothetical protein